MNAAAIVSSPEAYADPETWHAVAARLRRENPVCRIEAPDFDPFYAITRHADVSEIERQPAATFVGAPKRIPIRYRVRAA